MRKFQLLITSSCFFLSVTSFFNLTVDYEGIIDKYHHEDKTCFFEEPELTLKTIAKWPKDCPYVGGALIINQNFDVPTDKLKETWKKFDLLQGNLQIINTSFKNLNFLPKFRKYCDRFGAYFLNNSHLENLDFLLDTFQYIGDSLDCVFQIDNNAELDASKICKNQDFLKHIGVEKDVGITGNKVDCGCNGVLNKETQDLERFQNCRQVVGKLIITDIDKPLDFLSKLRVISGDLEITNTSLKNLDFLGNLKEIRVKTNFSNHRINIDIHDNPQLITLGLGALKTFTNLHYEGHLNVNLQNLHPDFCISIQEMINFLNINTKFINIDAGYCSQGTVALNSPKLCHFATMESLESGCVYLLGDLSIDSGDERFSEKLENVVYIFGSVTIQNTNFFSVNFLKNLKRVVNLNESLPIMRILSNSNLQSLKFPELEIFVSRNNRVIISDNHPKLFDKVLDCLKFQYTSQTNVSFNGGPCRSIPHTLHAKRYNYDTHDNIEFDFDFDTDMDYTEDGKASWYDLYDGGANLESDTLQSFQQLTGTLKDLNNMAAVVGFSVNIFHLIVLFQRDLRTNFIYILMIGISICDILFATTFILEYSLENGWIYTKNTCIRPEYHIWISRLEAPIQEFTRKSSAVLAFMMTLFRTLSVILPTNHLMITISKPRWAVLTVVLVYMVQGGWDSTTFLLCRRKYTIDETCHDEYNRYNGFYVQCIEDEESQGETNILQNLMQIDGHFTILLAIFYLIVTFLLLNQLRVARNRRRTLKTAESHRENTSLLVTFMAITFFLSEVSYGFYFISLSYFQKYFGKIAGIMNDGQVFLWSLVTFNSTIHCLICFGLSSQYRGAIGKMLCFWYKKKEKSSKSGAATDMATATVVS